MEIKQNIYLFDKPLLALILNGKLSLDEFPEKLGINEFHVCELLNYLKENNCVDYIKTMGRGFEGIKGLKITAKGTDVVLGRTTVREAPPTQIIHNQSVINGNQNQVAQTTGDNSPISQIIDNSQINVLKQLIEQDTELDESKKRDLFSILEKFNTLKESGENATSLIKKVGGIAIKYLPLFFGLLK